MKKHYFYQKLFALLISGFVSIAAFGDYTAPVAGPFDFDFTDKIVAFTESTATGSIDALVDNDVSTVYTVSATEQVVEITLEYPIILQGYGIKTGEGTTVTKIEYLNTKEDEGIGVWTDVPVKENDPGDPAWKTYSIEDGAGFKLQFVDFYESMDFTTNKFRITFAAAGGTIEVAEWQLHGVPSITTYHHQYADCPDFPEDLIAEHGGTGLDFSNEDENALASRVIDRQWKPGTYATDNGRAFWLTYTFDAPETVGTYLLSTNFRTPLAAPKTWTLQGSDDGESWTVLDTQTDFKFPATQVGLISGERVFYEHGSAYEFKIASPAAYKIYKLDVTQNVEENGNSQLLEWQLFSNGGGSCTPTDIVFAESSIQKLLTDDDFTITAVSVSSGAISYASTNESAATVNAETGEVTIVGVGTATITATQAADATYCAGSAAYELTITDPPSAIYGSIKGEDVVMKHEVWGMVGGEWKLIETLEKGFYDYKVVTSHVSNKTYVWVHTSVDLYDGVQDIQFLYTKPGGHYAQEMWLKRSPINHKEGTIATDTTYNGYSLLNVYNDPEYTYCLFRFKGGIAENNDLIPYDNKAVNSPVEDDETAPVMVSASAVTQTESSSVKLSLDATDANDFFYLINYTDDGEAKEEITFKNEITIEILDASSFTVTPIDFSGNKGEPYTVGICTASDIRFTQSVALKTTTSDNFTLEAQTSGSGAISYTSSDEEVATVDAETGEVSIVGIGETTITADQEAADYCAGSASYTLRVSCTASDIAFTQSNIQKLLTDDNFTITAVVSVSSGAISYGSTNESVATVNAETGEVTILGVGSTSISAAQEATTDYCAGSASYALTVASGTGIAGIDSKPNVYVANGKLVIEYIEIPIAVSVYDITGQHILYTTDKTLIDVSSLTKGIYIVRITNSQRIDNLIKVVIK